jgi:hypothetical protein
VWVVSPDAPQSLEAAHARHRKIQHDHIGIELKIALASHLARFGLGDDCDFGV